MVFASDIRASDITKERFSSMPRKHRIFFLISFCPTVAPRLMLALMYSHVDADIVHFNAFLCFAFCLVSVTVPAVTRKLNSYAI